ncbi:MAG: hypothetical protein QOE70_1272 [Chthoniobacter sp.]|jgi:uncharacterized membrane protein|nr:hypothetical protein [Chthoniobacter sp.]
MWPGDKPVRRRERWPKQRVLEDARRLMPRRDSLLARSLEPLASAMWLLFVVWTLVIAALWLGGLGEPQINSTITNRGLRDALLLVVGGADALWLTLATANLYLELAAREGVARTRLWTLLIFGAALVLAACSTRFGYPLGSVVYTNRLGPKLGPVPFGWPLLWFSIIVSGRELAKRLLPRASHTMLALATGTLAVITELNLDPLATQFRLFWFWYARGTHLPSSAPWNNHAIWFLAATLLAWAFREENLVRQARPQTWQPALIILIMNTLFLAAHLCSAFSR